MAQEIFISRYQRDNTVAIVQSTPCRGLKTTPPAMDKERKFIAKRTDVLRKLNAESLQLIERGLLGDLPDKLKPPPLAPVRGQSTELAVAKHSGLLSSCLPVPDSPKPQSDDDVSPLRKTFSFRDKFSRISFLKKDKEKAKWKTEDETKPNIQTEQEQEYKSSKRFWFFRNKELMEKKKQHKPIYKRSKSFEFLPRAIEENSEESVKNSLTKNQSYAFGSSDTMVDPWSSTESLEYLSNVYYNKEDSVFLKSIKEFPSESSHNNSSISNATSASSGLVVNIMKGKSMQDLLDEFEKAVDMFSENYMSDCEPYTKTNKELSVKEKRLSSSLSNLPSPKVMVPKVNQISDDFKAELSKLLSVKSVSGARTVRRGSVTDWFVLEDKNTTTAEQNKYRRAQKKPTQRVRRISSTKYNANFTYIATGNINVRYSIIKQASRPGTEQPGVPASVATSSALLQGAELVLQEYRHARAKLAAATKDIDCAYG